MHSIWASQDDKIGYVSTESTSGMDDLAPPVLAASPRPRDKAHCRYRGRRRGPFRGPVGHMGPPCHSADFEHQKGAFPITFPACFRSHLRDHAVYLRFAVATSPGARGVGAGTIRRRCSIRRRRSSEAARRSTKGPLGRTSPTENQASTSLGAVLALRE